MAKARTIASGEIRSRNTDFRYGRYEVTIDPPDKGSAPGNGAGFLAAMFTWHTPRDVNWREIDIEVMGNNDAGFLTNLFFANNQPQYSPNIEKPNPNTKPAAAFNSKAANKYAFEWLPGKVNWYVNDALVRTLSENPADGAANYLGSLKVSKLGSKVVMNFWSLNNASVGGLMSTNQYPMEAKFDNFRYYRWDEDGDKVKYPETP
jgi:beta-glucanase (GH16 family)